MKILRVDTAFTVGYFFTMAQSCSFSCQHVTVITVPNVPATGQTVLLEFAVCLHQSLGSCFMSADYLVIILVIFQCQIRFGGRKEIATDSDSR